MSEQSAEPTTATDLEAGATKPGGDYGDTDGDDTGGGAGGGSMQGGDDQPGDWDERGDGAAVPDEPGADAAQGGVQEAFGVAPQLD